MLSVKKLLVKKGIESSRVKERGENCVKFGSKGYQWVGGAEGESALCKKTNCKKNALVENTGAGDSILVERELSRSL